MSIDPKIKEAIKTAVAELEQSERLARKLESWFQAVATGSEDITDLQSTGRHLEVLYGEVQLEAGEMSNEEEVS